MITTMGDVWPPLPTPEDPGLTVKEVAARLGVSQSLVRRLIADGDLRAGRHGNSPRVLMRDLKEYCQRVWS